ALLDEAVGSEVDARRELHGVAFDPKLHRQAGLTGLRDELLDVFEARLRRERGAFLGAAEDTDEAPHLGQRLPAGLLDDLERLAPFSIPNMKAATIPERNAVNSSLTNPVSTKLIAAIIAATATGAPKG